MANMGSERKRQIRKSLLKRDGNICGICKKPITGRGSIDHILARINGGSNRLANLRLTHVLCNTTKNTLVDQPLAKMKEKTMEVLKIATPKHRIMRVPISPEILVRMFTEKNCLEVTSGIPKGASFRGFSHDPSTNHIVIFVEHDSFNEVPENCHVPSMFVCLQDIKKWSPS